MARSHPPLSEEQGRLVERLRSTVDVLHVLRGTRDSVLRELADSGMSHRHIEAALGRVPTESGQDRPRLSASSIRRVIEAKP